MIKKIILSLLFLLFPGFVFAQEKIDNFDVIIQINNDASINVTERIDYDFGVENRHGIYREIPYKYKARGGNYNLRFKEINVVDEKGKSYNFEISNQGKNKKIRIGDADKFVTGKKSYVITYEVERAINYFEDYDELYWNVTGNEWEVTILNAKAIVVLPNGVEKKLFKYDCFVGGAGSTEKCLSSKLEFSGTNNVANVLFSSDKLQSMEGLTIVAGLPKGIIIEPSRWEKILDSLKDNYILFLPLLIFLIMFYLWYTRGRDPKGRGVIVAQFDVPDDLTPAQVGTLIDEKADQIDISAEIINLAIKGYLKIHKQEKDGFIFKQSEYIFEKVKNDSAGKLNDYESYLLEKLFDKKSVQASIHQLKENMEKMTKKSDKNGLIYKGLFGMVSTLANFSAETNNSKDEKFTDKEIVKLSELTNSFYTDFEEIKKKVFNSLVEKKYFVKNPNTVKGKYIGFGIFIMLLVCLIIFQFMETQNIFFVVFIFPISFLIIIAFAMIMPKKTKKGVLTYEYILGLKKYLEVAEKDRINFHNAPEKKPEHFEKLLPFAMVLGVEKAWAKQFEGIYNQEPNWYTGTGAFNSLALASSLGNFGQKLGTTINSQASSGSSGFSGGGSGGGFGGGGGGSW